MVALVGAGDDVVSTFFLVGGDVVWIIDGRQRGTKLLHMRCDLALEVPLEDRCALHRGVEGKPGDIPATKDEVIGMDHRQNIRKRCINILSSCIKAKANSASAKKRTNIVGALDSGLGMPCDVVPVGENGRN